MIRGIIICLILWLLPILTVLCIYYIDRYKDETLNQYIVRNNIEVFTFMAFIPYVGISCMLILILMFVINRKYE